MPGQISFRSAREADLIDIMAFPKDRTELFFFFPSATHPLTLERLRKQLCERHESTVMVEHNSSSKDSIIGFANFYNVENRKIGFIGNAIIKPDKRGMGFGKQLIQAMIRSGFKQLKLNEVHLSCYKNNTSALSFYKHLGFKAYAKETRKDMDGKPTELIHLRLKKPLATT